MVNDEIQKSSLPKPVMFTWLTPEQRYESIDYLKRHRTPDITKIAELKDCVYSRKKYPDVDRDKFTRAYKNWKASSPQSFMCADLSHESGVPGSSTSSSSGHYFTCSDGSNKKNDKQKMS